MCTNFGQIPNKDTDCTGMFPCGNNGITRIVKLPILWDMKHLVHTSYKCKYNACWKALMAEYGHIVTVEYEHNDRTG